MSDAIIAAIIGAITSLLTILIQILSRRRRQRVSDPSLMKKVGLRRIFVVAILTFLIVFAPITLALIGIRVSRTSMQVSDLNRRIAKAFPRGLSQIPIGAVVAFFLSPNDVAELAPYWLPADGTKVHDGNSPLYDVNLPNLTDRVILGATRDANVVPGSPTNIGGATTLSLSTSTGNVVYTESYDRETDVAPHDGYFVIDTITKERAGAKHIHQIGGSIPLPLPPYRKLVYMVRVR
jgi:hypothetical protein